MTLVAALLASMHLAATTSPQDNQDRSRLIEALQQTGINIGALPACALAGYEVDTDAIDRYMRHEIEFAKADGMYEAIAKSYIDIGQKGQSDRDLKSLTRLRRLAEAGDQNTLILANNFVDEIADRCDLIASRSETSAMFSYTPPNDLAAKRKLRSLLGLPLGR